jgi:hypothetical protein
MAFLRSLLGLDRLERRVDELSAAVEGLTERVQKLEPEGEQRHNCHDWQAWHDRMPGSRPTLHVTGRCEFPTSGYAVRLERGEPQGTNPRDLLLDLVVTPPTGPVTQVVTEVEARYEEETDAEYDTATIRPDGPQIEVKTTS